MPLAIDGGAPTIAEPLPPEWPGLNWVDDAERQAVLSALGGTAFSGSLEDDLVTFYGCPVAVPVNSGSGALFVATAALGLRPGMEVLVPGFCWIPTFASVVSTGAIPVPVEVGDDLNIDAADMERKITPRTRAVLVVHMCGAAADMDAVMRVAERHRLLVIEDCAQHGAGTFRGRKVGLIGDVGCFSLQQNKHFTCFSGGYLLSRRADLAALLWQTMDAGMMRVMNVISHERDDLITWGQGRHLNVLAQAMARAQLAKAPAILGAMRRAQRRIIAGIGAIPGLSFRPLPDPEGDCGSFLVTYWPDRDTAHAAAAALKAEGVPPWIFPLEDYGAHMYYHMLPLVRKVGWTPGSSWPWNAPENAASSWSYARGALPRSDALFARGVVMAVPSRLSDAQCDLIARAYRTVAAALIGRSACASKATSTG